MEQAPGTRSRQRADMRGRKEEGKPHEAKKRRRKQDERGTCGALAHTLAACLFAPAAHPCPCDVDAGTLNPPNDGEVRVGRGGSREGGETSCSAREGQRIRRETSSSAEAQRTSSKAKKKRQRRRSRLPGWR